MPLSLPPEAFGKEDGEPDRRFYAFPRFVTHIDDHAIAAVTQAYRRLLPPGGIVLDLMSSWVSHLPPEVAYAEVVGHGMNEAELAANPRLTRFFLQDLNIEPDLPLESASVDACTICVSVQYLEKPVAVLAEIRRVLRPGGPLVISFSNRCFPTKAVAIWRSLGSRDHLRLVELYLSEAGFTDVSGEEAVPPGGQFDPLWIACGRT